MARAMQSSGCRRDRRGVVALFTTFGVVLHWLSDQGYHFKNTVMQRSQKTLKAKHHFMAANCPWSNGTIEAACKQAIRVARVMLAEFKTDTYDWDKIAPVMQSTLNNSPSSRLQYRTPMFVFTSHQEMTPLALVLKDGTEMEIASIEFIQAQKLMEIEKSARIMAEVHTHVIVKSTKTRIQAIERHNKRT
jgi:hypothetical protein